MSDRMFTFAVKEFDDEARMRDLDIARALGFDRVRNIRLLIGRHMATLEAHGDVVRCSYKPDAVDDEDEGGLLHGEANPLPNAGGRPGVEYWLNEWQALFICTRSDAANAIEVTSQMIEVFIAWRQGRLAPHPDAMPRPAPAPQICGYDLGGPELSAFLSLAREMRLTAGRAAARAMWEHSAFAPLLRAQAVDRARFFDDGRDDDLADVATFVGECFDITGDRADSVAASVIMAQYRAWRDKNNLPPMQDNAVAKHIAAYLGGYRCPDTGRRVARRKASTWFYDGLKPRGRALNVV